MGTCSWRENHWNHWLVIARLASPSQEVPQAKSHAGEGAERRPQRRAGGGRTAIADDDRAGAAGVLGVGAVLCVMGGCLSPARGPCRWNGCRGALGPGARGRARGCWPCRRGRGEVPVLCRQWQGAMRPSSVECAGQEQNRREPQGAGPDDGDHSEASARDQGGRHGQPAGCPAAARRRGLERPREVAAGDGQRDRGQGAALEPDGGHAAAVERGDGAAARCQGLRARASRPARTTGRRRLCGAGLCCCSVRVCWVLATWRGSELCVCVRACVCVRVCVLPGTLR